ncbi:hypothetical protein FMUND_14965 [Fusarium mundagurra]|uniref:Uncharacterized protein n=1 Tax=Fusarium mundagurra TaxID=1567541 RepID=A0A8H5XRQ0_9HYPO|nr:hypothetical protein FMUND_14965 [Fusarium mundagurra]
MSSNNLISERSPSSSRPPSIFSCRSEDELTGESSDDASTIIDSDILSEDGTQGVGTAMLTDKSILSIPPSLKHYTQVDSVLEWVQDVQHPEDPRLDLRCLGVGACCAESNQHQRITNLHSPSLPSLADCHQRTMSSHEWTPVSSATPSSCPPSIFSSNVDDEFELAETSSNDTVTISSCLKHLTAVDPGLERIQNTQHQAYLMGTMVPESHPVSICLQLLGPAILHLHNLQEALGLKPMEIPEETSTQTVCDYKKSIALMEHEIDVFFNADTVATQLETTKACLIRGIIFSKDGLLEIMRNLRAYFQDPERVQSLPITLWCLTATMYVEICKCCIEVSGSSRETGDVGTT